MSRKKLSPAEQSAREAEALNKPINPTGEGEHEAIKALMSPEFAEMSNFDAAQIALILQNIVRGQNSLLARYDTTSDQIVRLNERQDRIDKELQARLDTQNKFVEEVLDRAESLKRTGIENDKLIAKGIAEYQRAKENAVAMLTTKNLALEQALAQQPKVMVVSSGTLVTTMQHGQQITQIIPEEIRVRNKRWVLPVGKAVEVPQIVADIMSQRRASQVETLKRQELLSKNLEGSKLAEEWGKVEGSRTDSMPL